MSKVLERFAVALGVDIDDKNFKRYKEGLDTVSTSLKTITAVGGIASTGLFAMANNAAQSADVLGKAADKISMGTDKLQEYIYASEQSGGSQEAFIKSFTSLESAIDNAMMGSGAAIQSFKLMGIELADTNGVVKNTESVMRDISNVFANLNDAGKKRNLAKQLGFDESMITMLQGGTKALDELRERSKALGDIKSPQMIADSAAFGDNLDDTKKVFGGLLNMINSEAIPVFSSLMRQFNDWYIANKKVIQQNLGKFIELLTKFVKSFILVLKDIIFYVDEVVQVFGGWEKVLKFVGFALGALALYKIGMGVTSLITILTAGAKAFMLFGNGALLAQVKALAIPIAIGTLIAAIVLLIDEIYTFATGGKTVLEPFFNWFLKKIEWFKSTFPTIATAIASVLNIVVTVFSGFATLLTQLWSTIKGDLNISEFFDKQFSKFGTFGDTFKDGFNSALTAINSFYKSIQEFSFFEFFDSQFTKVKDIFEDLKNTVINPFKDVKNSISKGLDAVSGFLGFSDDEKEIASSPVAQVAAASPVHNTTSQHTKTINNKTDVVLNVTIQGNSTQETLSELEQAVKRAINNTAPRIE